MFADSQVIFKLIIKPSELDPGDIFLSFKNLL